MPSSIWWECDMMTLGLQGWYLSLVPQGHSLPVSILLWASGYPCLWTTTTWLSLLASLAGAQGWMGVLLAKILTWDWLPWKKRFLVWSFPHTFLCLCICNLVSLIKVSAEGWFKLFKSFVNEYLIHHPYFLITPLIKPFVIILILVCAIFSVIVSSLKQFFFLISP